MVHWKKSEEMGMFHYWTNKQKYFGKDGLYFCGYWISPTGQIREISLDAKKIARDIAKKESLKN